MEVATGALGTLLPKLAQLLLDEYYLQKSAKKNIEFLLKELEATGAALRAVGEVPQDQLDGVVRIWARDVRELSYNMEDIVDTFLVRIQGPEIPSKRCTKKLKDMFTKATTRRWIAQQIKDIKELVREVAERRNRYRVNDIAPAKTSADDIAPAKTSADEKCEATSSYDPRIIALYTKATNLVGIDEAREELITRFVKEGGTPTKEIIVSITGFGGLGKTTLAKAVYDNLKDQFDLTVWVSVSQNLDVCKIFKHMLYELDKNQYNIYYAEMSQKQLIDQVKGFLEKKRYLIVIDDLWNSEAWDIIRCALPENGLKSTIITTTRIFDVAEHVGGCFKMKPLTHEMSEKLFYGRIFGSKDNCPHQFSDVSEKILKKCGGVPLAIVTTSSLLANKSRNIKEWNYVCDLIGTGLGNDPVMNNMRKILLLSYYDLKPHLKTCLLYLSIFPEDSTIGRDRLIWRWIAEGFVEHGVQSKSLFEIGLSYFNELLNRSLIQPAQLGGHHSVACRVHDMVLDLICLSREESFATILYSDSEQIVSSLGGKVRRLSLHCTTWPAAMDTSRIRSLTISSFCIIDSMPPFPSHNFLRVLDLEDCNLEHHPSLDLFVGKLHKLRYLSLRGTRCAGKVLVGIGKLEFLQSLDLRGTSVKELPSSILGLTQLMSLYVDEHTRLPPNGLRNLCSLEVLLRVTVDTAYTAGELGHLTELRTLDVCLTEDKEGRWDESICNVLVGSLGKLHKIQTLVVFTHGVVAADLEGSLELSSLCNLCHLDIKKTSRLPRWIDHESFLLLADLEIVVDQVQREDIIVLSKLPALLKVRVDISWAGRWQTQVFQWFTMSAGAFPCVTQCTFVGFSMLPSMFAPGAMPRLEYFEFQIRLQDWYGAGGLCIVDHLALGHFPSLYTVRLRLSGKERPSEDDDVVTKAEEALRHEARVHPNHPDTFIRTDDVVNWVQCIEDAMVNSEAMKLQRLKWKAHRIKARVDHLMKFYYAMRREADEMWKLMEAESTLGSDVKHKVELFREQLIATENHAFSERSPYYWRYLDTVSDEDIAAMQRALEMVTVEYPRFTSKLEELRTAFSMQQQDNGTDKIANNNVTEEKMADRELEAGPNTPLESITHATD